MLSPCSGRSQLLSSEGRIDAQAFPARLSEGGFGHMTSAGHRKCPINAHQVCHSAVGSTGPPHFVEFLGSVLMLCTHDTLLQERVELGACLQFQSVDLQVVMAGTVAACRQHVGRHSLEQAKSRKTDAQGAGLCSVLPQVPNPPHQVRPYCSAWLTHLLINLRWLCTQSGGGVNPSMALGSYTLLWMTQL